MTISSCAEAHHRPPGSVIEAIVVSTVHEEGLERCFVGSVVVEKAAVDVAFPHIVQQEPGMVGVEHGAVYDVQTTAVVEDDGSGLFADTEDV